MLDKSGVFCDFGKDDAFYNKNYYLKRLCTHQNLHPKKLVRENDGWTPLNCLLGFLTGTCSVKLCFNFHPKCMLIRKIFNSKTICHDLVT